ncbi:MAG: hypothetical protein U1D67_04510 [Dehalococcoidia bacterium]|nr:hypothetical protein [Dehalococcoidia bacterium]MDZ4246366.1 hypothetical protein [Dehalococcoidia bacterium]
MVALYKKAWHPIYIGNIETRVSTGAYPYTSWNLCLPVMLSAVEASFTGAGGLSVNLHHPDNRYQTL